MSLADCPGGDCDGTWCDFCGCCQHGADEHGCRMQDAPEGIPCKGYGGCGCEGEGWYDKPVQRPEKRADPADDRPRQEHQETSLFDLEPEPAKAGGA